jgi:hypothetical protein
MPPRRQQQASVQATPASKDASLDKEPVMLHADARVIAVEAAEAAEAQRLATEAAEAARALDQSALDRALKMANERMRMRERQEVVAAVATAVVHEPPVAPEVALPEKTPAAVESSVGQLDGSRLRRSRIPMTHQLNRRPLY